MTLRLPRSYVRKPRDNVLDYEIVQEQAAALGRLGRALEAALAALSRHDRACAEEAGTALAASAGVREKLSQHASYALWCFVVQREACGLRDQRLIIRDFGVPLDVQNRMGVFGGRENGSRKPSA
jgi:hypothetical protein